MRASKGRLAKVLVLLPALLLLAGCGDDSGEAATHEAGTPLKVTARDYDFTAPTKVKAGRVQVQFANAGKTFHQVTFARIKDGATRSDLVQAAKVDLGGAVAITHLALSGGVNGLTPGATQTGEVDLSPGRWALMCFIPGTEAQNHAAKGMVHPFTVEGPAAAPTAPAGGTPVALRDMSFTIPTIKPGPTTLRVTNEGPQPHEIAIYRVLPGKTGSDVVDFLTAALSARADQYAEPPFALAGGVPGIEKGLEGAVSIDFAPGLYVAACLIPDPGARKPHVSLGMLQTFTVR